MSFTLKNATLHILDTANGIPILSDTILLIDQKISDYIATVADKTFHSDDAKDCVFRDDSSVWEQCKNASWDVLTISKSIAEHIFNIMRRNSEIPPSDVIAGISQIDGSDFLFLLKLDYKVGVTHYVDNSNSGTDVRIIPYKTLLPPQTAKIGEAFFINMNTPNVKVVERKYTIDGIKDFYLSTQILACTENRTPRQTATKVLKAAEKIAEMYYSKDDDIETHISSTMLNELQQNRPLVVENLGHSFFPNNAAAQEEFFERLASSNITKDEALTLSERFQRKFEKQAIKTTSGVEIKIPTQLYSNSDEIEFINNPDGTVSLLIKNIKL